MMDVVCDKHISCYSKSKKNLGSALQILCLPASSPYARPRELQFTGKMSHFHFHFLDI